MYFIHPAHGTVFCFERLLEFSAYNVFKLDPVRFFFSFRGVSAMSLDESNNSFSSFLSLTPLLIHSFIITTHLFCCLSFHIICLTLLINSIANQCLLFSLFPYSPLNYKIYCTYHHRHMCVLSKKELMCVGP